MKLAVVATLALALAVMAATPTASTFIGGGEICTTAKGIDGPGNNVCVSRLPDVSRRSPVVPPRGIEPPVKPPIEQPGIPIPIPRLNPPRVPPVR